MIQSNRLQIKNCKLMHFKRVYLRRRLSQNMSKYKVTLRAIILIILIILTISGTKGTKKTKSKKDKIGISTKVANKNLNTGTKVNITQISRDCQRITKNS